MIETKLLEVETLGHRIAELITAEADSWPADLIVIGTHGRFGSVAEGVARIAGKPVLLMRAH